MPPQEPGLPRNNLTAMIAYAKEYDRNTKLKELNPRKSLEIILELLQLSGLAARDDDGNGEQEEGAVQIQSTQMTDGPTEVEKKNILSNSQQKKNTDMKSGKSKRVIKTTTAFTTCAIPPTSRVFPTHAPIPSTSRVSAVADLSGIDFDEPLFEEDYENEKSGKGGGDVPPPDAKVTINLDDIDFDEDIDVF